MYNSIRATILLLLSFFIILQQAKAQDLLFPFKGENYKYGYMNEAGDIVVSSQFDFAGDFYASYFYYQSKYTIGQRKYSPSYASHTGVYKSALYDSVSRLSHLRNGKPSTYTNTAIIVQEGQLGYINSDGSILIEPKFSVATPFHCGFAIVFEDEWKVINEQGEKVKSLPIDDFMLKDPYHSLRTAVDSCTYVMAYKKGDRYGLINSRGDIVKDTIFSSLPVHIDNYDDSGKRTGKTIITTEYNKHKVQLDSLGEIIKIIAPVKLGGRKSEEEMEAEEKLEKEKRRERLIKKYFTKVNGRYGMVSDDDKFLIKPRIGEFGVFIFKDGIEKFAVVGILRKKKRDLRGIIDLERQKYAFEPQKKLYTPSYGYFGMYHAKYFSLSIGKSGKVGIYEIDENSNIAEVYECKGCYVTNDESMLYHNNGQNGQLIDIHTKEIIGTFPVYFGLIFISEKYIMGVPISQVHYDYHHQTRGYEVYDYKGNVIIPNGQFQSIQLAGRDMDYFDVKINNKHGIVNTDVAYVIPPFFDKIHNFQPEKPVIVSINEKYALLDKNAKMIAEPIFDLILPTQSPNLFLVWFGKRTGYVNTKGDFLGFTEKDILHEMHNYKQ